jgi:tripartite-type tricarboxylate transporter receptor subunit TctC
VVQMAAITKGAGIKLKIISYDKPTERYAALLGSQVDALFEQPGDVRQFLEAKQMKPILTVLKAAPKAFGNVPSLKEAGLNIPVLMRVRGFWAHKKVPAARREYLRKACKAAFNTKDYQAFNKKKFMDLARSYYDGKDAIKLVNDMMDTYRKSAK